MATCARTLRTIQRICVWLLVACAVACLLPLQPEVRAALFSLTLVAAVVVVALVEWQLNSDVLDERAQIARLFSDWYPAPAGSREHPVRDIDADIAAIRAGMASRVGLSPSTCPPDEPPRPLDPEAPTETPSPGPENPPLDGGKRRPSPLLEGETPEEALSRILGGESREVSEWVASREYDPLDMWALEARKLAFQAQGRKLRAEEVRESNPLLSSRFLAEANLLILRIERIASRRKSSNSPATGANDAS